MEQLYLKNSLQHHTGHRNTNWWHKKLQSKCHFDNLLLRQHQHWVFSVPKLCLSWTWFLAKQGGGVIDQLFYIHLEASFWSKHRAHNIVILRLDQSEAIILCSDQSEARTAPSDDPQMVRDAHRAQELACTHTALWRPCHLREHLQGPSNQLKLTFNSLFTRCPKTLNITLTARQTDRQCL